MTEGRKHAILFGATLLCARKLIETIESDRPNFAKQYFVDRAAQRKAQMRRLAIRFASVSGGTFARSAALSIHAATWLTRKSSGTFVSPLK